MYKAAKTNQGYIVELNGVTIERGFNYLAEAQQRADELNEEAKNKSNYLL